MGFSSKRALTLFNKYLKKSCILPTTILKANELGEAPCQRTPAPRGVGGRGRAAPRCLWASSLSDTRIAAAHPHGASHGSVCAEGRPALAAASVPTKDPPTVCAPQPSPAARALLFWSPGNLPAVSPRFKQKTLLLPALRSRQSRRPRWAEAQEEHA